MSDQEVTTVGQDAETVVISPGVEVSPTPESAPEPIVLSTMALHLYFTVTSKVHGEGQGLIHYEANGHVGVSKPAWAEYTETLRQALLRLNEATNTITATHTNPDSV